MAAGAAGDLDAASELDEVVVSGMREYPLWRRAQSVAVITEREIRASSAETVVDLLRQEANLNLQSFFGSDKFATIDVRGMGATATSNVLVMVDGVRLNTDDLAGADFSSLPLSQVVRVEVLRGGNGVRYGNGAVGGVINILTRKAGRDTRELELQIRRGAFDTDDLRGHAAASWGPVALGIELSDFDSDGYRHNEFIDKRDGAVRLGLRAGDLFELTLRSSRHEDSYGLPGPLSLADFRRSSFARRQTQRPYDRGETVEERHAVTAALDHEHYGRLELRASYRDRANPYFIGFNPNGAPRDQINRIDTASHSTGLKYEYLLARGARTHALILGADFSNADYLRQENGTQVPGSSKRRRGRVDERGYYGELTLEPWPALDLSIGYRTHRYGSAQTDRTLQRRCRIELVAQTVIVQTPFGPLPLPLDLPVERDCVSAFALDAAQRDRSRDEAWSIGASWALLPALTVYASAHQSFRNPNVDERLFASDSLHSQRGRGLDAGIRFSPSPRIELAAAVFALDVDDEIVYAEDAAGQALNRNLDRRTRRRGGELDLKWRPLDVLALRGSLGYVRPRIAGLDADIPLVPRLTANLGADWQIASSLELRVAATHVGRRADGNDATNDLYPALPPYTTCDLSMRWTHRRLELFAGVSNLFNEIYSTVGYSATVYPMPERHAYAGLRLSFSNP
ncbi:MAG TPA: TonB-dependent receptor [Gammaproteobacteria bacterium]|nr:TonB-dependent receptor [Gammaproteobacteria bacterium]